MASFQRMRLMRDEEYERLRQKQISSYDPELRVLARLEDERRSVLDSTQLNDSEKVALMNHIGSRMKEVRAINKNEEMVAGIAKKAAAPLGVALAAAGPVAVAGASATSGEEAVDTKAGDLLKEKRELLLNNLPSRAHEKANELLDYMEANPDHVSLNEKFELVTKGKAVPDSNFLQLFESLFSGKSKHKIKQQKGIVQFLSGLKYVKNAGKLVSNPFYTDELGGSTLGKQLGHGKRKVFQTPGMPKALLVYPLHK